MEAIALRWQAESAVAVKAAAEGRLVYTTSFESIVDSPGDAEKIAGARDLLAAFKQAGVLDKLDAVAAAPRAVRDTPGGAVFFFLLPELGQIRVMARACGGRVALAAQDADHAERVRAFEHGMALSTVCCRQFTLIDHLVGYACSALINIRFRESLVQHPVAGPEGIAMLDAAAAVLDRHGDLPPISVALEGDRLAALDAFEWTHTDDGKGGGILLTNAAEFLSNTATTPGPPQGAAPMTALLGLLSAGKCA